MNRKKVNAVTLGLFWMFSLGAVFILGILSAFTLHLGPGALDGGDSDLTLEQRELMLLLERHTGQPADIAAVMSVGSGEALPPQIEQALRSIMRMSDRKQRVMDANRLARGLPSRRLMAAMKFLQEVPANPGRNQVLGSFMEFWALEDGRRAMVFATSLKPGPERELAIEGALSGWGKSQTTEAWAWVVEQAGSSSRAERWLEIIISNLSGEDSGVGFQLLEQTPDSAFRDRMAVVVMAQILQHLTPREAITWLGEFPVSSRALVASHLAGNWAIAEPEEAAMWLYGIYPRQIAGISEVVREWVYAEPEQAAGWVWRTFSGEARRDLIDVVAEEWIGNDGPAPLAVWVNAHGPDPALDDAIARLALSTARVDPATALVWAQSILDPDERSMLEIFIGRQWIRMSPEQAEAGLPDLLESESARAALLEPVVEEYYIEGDEVIIVDELPFEEAEPAQ